MSAVLIRVRAELRARWRAWVSLTLMLGIFGGAVIAVAAGARRTDTAYQRFLQWSNAFDVAVPRFHDPSGTFGEVDLADVEALPQVRSFARMRILENGGEAISNDNVPVDGRMYVAVNR